MTSKVTLLRYIAIQRYMNIRAKIPHDNTQPNSNKAHQRHPRSMFFGSVSLYTAK